MLANGVLSKYHIDNLKLELFLELVKTREAYVTGWIYGCECGVFNFDLQSNRWQLHLVLRFLYSFAQSEIEDCSLSSQGPWFELLGRQFRCWPRFAFVGLRYKRKVVVRIVKWSIRIKSLPFNGFFSTSFPTEAFVLFLHQCTVHLVESGLILLISTVHLLHQWT